jgi:FPC/CPF motif-containing protein YcgG
MRKQMEGYWKMLDNMHKDDPKEYSDFISTQMDEMKGE